MAAKMHVLVVDDEIEIRVSLKEILEEEGYAVAVADDAAAAHALVNSVDCALVDIKLGVDNGIDLLRQFKQIRLHMPVIMISGHGTVALTAEAFKLGAHEFMEKPLRLIQVRACVRNALESVLLKKNVSEQERGRYPRPVYQSAIMRTLYDQVARLANVAEPVVIAGPSGAGKELVARALHYEGNRVEGPFVATNAASMPLNLAEDELFGHEKGAFTGAHGRRIGSLEQADNGTLFLDEIADMDPQIQAKLLRVLENGEVSRLGATKPVKVNVRVVAATHKDLGAMVNTGSFRHDLWYRLCAFVIRVPPLSERREDIPLLAETFLATACGEMALRKSFSDSALQFLGTHDFPGNIRELKHIVTRAVVLSDREIIDEDILAGVCSGGQRIDLRHDRSGIEKYSTLDFRSARVQFEKDFLDAALQRSSGNITTAAAEIGMAQSNLSRKLKELGLRFRDHRRYPCR
jgi:two-component system nitrogen regulation response regulator NtrX